MEIPEAYIPIDRRLAIVRNTTLPDATQGAALFADISGFTPLTEALVQALGPQRGAEVLTDQLNRVYGALITEVEHYGGTAIGFSGDAITCWFDADDGLRATTCALALQQAMQPFQALAVQQHTVTLALKVAVALGPVRRFVIGDAHIQLIDALVGETLERLAAAEQLARTGEIVLDPAASAALGPSLSVLEWRTPADSTQRYAVIAAVQPPHAGAPWPLEAYDPLPTEAVRPWLLPPVYQRLISGLGDFLTELRPAIALFLHFSGIDYDHDEDAHANLNAYIRWVQHVLDHYGAFLLQLTVGDKGSYLYAGFGAPLAHEDDAIRAAAAALELRSPPPEADVVDQVQIGISQGQMRTGAYGSETRRTYAILGDHVNLAARLMQRAPAGQIYVSHTAQKSAADAFIWHQLPPLSIKGKAGPVEAFRLDAAKERQTLHLLDPQDLLPLVGRDAELATVQHQLVQAFNGRGQIINVTAEAGMGKSRLIAEIVRLARAHGFTAYGGECQSYGTTDSYLVWESIWQTFFGVQRAATVADQIRTLTQAVAALDPALLPRLPLLAPVLNLAISDNDLTQAMDAKLRKASLEALLVDCMRAWTHAADQSRPLLLVLEDCHWIDPVSHDLLEVIGRAITDLPVVLVMAYRPPDLVRLQVPRVTTLPHSTCISLTELAPAAATHLITLKLAQRGDTAAQLPPTLIGQIIARAQGNPFYIEELVNYVRDRAVNLHDPHAVEHLDLPASLHTLILSRIDQLTERQKITLKMASVIGRLFAFNWLKSMYVPAAEAHQIKADLDVLSRLELTPLDQPEPQATYLFKHIVTREVAYESLPFATRAALHEQIGYFIQRLHRDHLDQYLDLLAHHFWHSDNIGRKREYLRRAGEAAQAAYANETAIEYYRRLLPLLEGDERITIMRKLAQVLELVGEWGEAQALYEQGLELANQSGDQRTQAQCQSALGNLLWKRGEYIEAQARLARARAGFEASNDQAGVSQVLHYEGTVAAQQGDYDTARTLFEHSLAIRQQLGDKAGIASLFSNLGIIAHFQGELATARSLYEESLALRRELKDRWAIAVSLNNLGIVAIDQGDFTTARAWLEEAVALQREVGDKYYLADSLTSLAYFALDQGDYTQVQALLEESLIINRELGDRRAMAFLLEGFAGLAAEQQQPERALRLAGAAAAVREAVGAPIPPQEQAKLDGRLAPLRQTLGEMSASAVWQQGQQMTLEQAIDDALHS